MKSLLVALFCLSSILVANAQSANDPASRDDVILLLRTMHSHDFMQRTLAAQSAGMREFMRQQVQKEKGSVPDDFDKLYGKDVDDMLKSMPVDEITNALIPAYQKHFTHGDIEAMNTFYASPVGQKVLQELPGVLQEGMQAATPILSKYLNDWQEKTKRELKQQEKAPPAKSGSDSGAHGSS